MAVLARSRKAKAKARKAKVKAKGRKAKAKEKAVAVEVEAEAIVMVAKKQKKATMMTTEIGSGMKKKKVTGLSKTAGAMTTAGKKRTGEFLPKVLPKVLKEANGPKKQAMIEVDGNLQSDSPILVR